jgi:hypothetical protein
MYDFITDVNKAFIIVCSNHAFMPSRAPKGGASQESDGGGAASAGDASQGKAKKNLGLETASLFQWLTVPENRNIITGAAGMFAAWSFSVSARRAAAAARCLYLIARQALLRTVEGWLVASLLFPKTKDSPCSPSISRPHAAMLLTRNKHRTSIHTLSASFTMPKIGSVHLALALLQKIKPRVCVFSFPLLKSHMSTGIHDIPGKLNSICPSFDLWNSWFGESQKYDPTSVVTNDSQSDQGENDEQGHDRQEDEVVALERGGDAVNADDGGPDAHLDSSSVAASPRDNSRDIRADAVAAAGAAKNALSKHIKSPGPVPVVTSPSLASSSSGSFGQSGKTASFDAVYAKCSENKVQTMKDIQTSKRDCALLQQSREHHFQSQKILLEANAANEDRKVRQKIEFEKTLATLFVQDSSGDLARNYLALLRDHRQQEAAVDSAPPAHLQSFASQFAQPRLDNSP